MNAKSNLMQNVDNPCHYESKNASWLKYTPGPGIKVPILLHYNLHDGVAWNHHFACLFAFIVTSMILEFHVHSIITERER